MKMIVRNRDYDCVKGIAIILMVLAHAMEPSFVHFRRWIYLFHMPVFFICAGWFYQPPTSMIDFVRKKILRLWLPYVVWTGIFLLCNNLFIYLNIYSSSPEFCKNFVIPYIVATQWDAGAFLRAFCKLPFMVVNSQLSLALWFLRSLFLSSILFAVVDYICSKVLKVGRLALVVHGCAAMLFLLVNQYLGNGSLMRIVDCFWGRPTLVAYAILTIGVGLRRLGIDMTKLTVNIKVFVCILSFIILVIMSFYGRVELGAGYISSIPLLVFASLCGWCFLVTLSSILGIGEIHYFAIYPLLAYVGKNTMPILLFHFLAFKIVTAVGVLFQSDHLCVIASFPTFYKGLSWALAYTFVGVAIPIAANSVYRGLVRRLKDLRQ